MSLSLTLGGIDLAGAAGVDANGVQWSVSQFAGWGAVRSTIQLVQKPRASGAWAGLSYGGARHMSISGLVNAPTQDLLTAAIDNLISVTSLASTTLTVVEGGRTRTIAVRREDEVIWTYLTGTLAQWSIAIVAPDPRKLGTALVGNTAQPLSTGGLAWGHAWPETWTTTTVSGTVTLTNPGNTVGPVILRIDGPCTGPQISHQGATGSSITFSSALALNAGEWLTINMDTRQVLANDQSNRAQYITNRGWSGFDPGINTWSFTASVYSALSLLTVTAYPAGD
jgi:hypothetical protein